MTNQEMETAIKFFMSRLPEADLAELDAQMTGSMPDNGMAGDAALGPNHPVNKRKAFLALDSAQRNAVRAGYAAHAQAFTDGEADFEKRFPDAGRLGR